MLSPIPGLSHLLYLTPEVTEPPAPAPPQTVPKEIGALIQIALDSAFGLRPLTQLHPRRFDTSARAHVAARRKGAGRVTVGVVKVVSMHIRLADAAAEVFGSVRCRDRTTAYAAGLVQTDGMWRMSSFRVL
ncbi:Rv3235 family protein [Corynebacterium pacaense]|uniref:Rv3235 family protein n=1 Tax=Corynebacterium pacaense TaxID=1816684 RepID=UPI0009BA669F|nr:Rv3235 family protein [Corynebacterium pacaense]